MSKFDFSAEALDQGLTNEEVLEFDTKVADFREAVEQTDLANADAETIRSLHNQWISVGVELFHIATKVVASRAVKETPPSVRENVGTLLLKRISGLFDRFRGGE